MNALKRKTAMTGRERKAAMILAGVTAASIARQLDVDRAHVSMVVNGLRRSERVELAIATAIGLPPDQAFPPAKAGAAA